jgi:DHA2 family methylenomycin A resistance protein-like MFS transporter
VPVVGAALLLGWQSLPRTTIDRAGKRVRFDLPGSGLFAASLGGVILIPALLKLDRPFLAAVSGIAGIAIGLLFVLWELRTDAPVVDMRLFTQSQFAASCASIGLSNLVMYTTLLALPLYLERVRGHSVQVSGLVLAALSAFAAIWGPLGGRWTDRRGRWLPAVTGGAALLAGSGLMVTVTRGTSLIPVAVALALMGMGIGVSGAPVQTAAVEAAPRERTGSAAGIFSTSRYFGSVAGSSVLAIVFARRPESGEDARFIALFAGLTVMAFLGLLVNTRVAARQ